MMQPEDHAIWKARLLRRLAVVVDDGQTYTVRLAAVRAVQEMLDADHRLRNEDPAALLDRVLHHWDRRPDMCDRRDVLVTVSRPPRSLRDVWE